jgi:hypothetical protein
MAWKSEELSLKKGVSLIVFYDCDFSNAGSLFSVEPAAKLEKSQFVFREVFACLRSAGNMGNNFHGQNKILDRKLAKTGRSGPQMPEHNIA